jgi:hypothetical protein
MNCSGFRILIHFSISVALSRISCLFFATTFDSHLSISITFHCAYAIAYTSMDYCTSTCTFVDRCTSTLMTFSSLMSFHAISYSIKCCSTTLSSFNSSMNTRSIDVVLGHVYFFACQLHLLLPKNSTIDVPIIYIL